MYTLSPKVVYTELIKQQRKANEIASWARRMGVESGGGGGRRDASPAVEKSAGDVPQKSRYFSIFFIDTCENFAFPNIFKIKWPKSEEKLNFGGRWDWVPMNPPPSKQNFVATPLARRAVTVNLDPWLTARKQQERKQRSKTNSIKPKTYKQISRTANPV